jgi:hypothetical protein
MPTEGLQRDLEGLGVRVVPFVDEDARLLVEVRRTARRQGSASPWPTAPAWRPAYTSTSLSSPATRHGSSCGSESTWFPSAEQEPCGEGVTTTSSPGRGPIAAGLVG